MNRDPRIVWLDDVSPADWIGPKLHPWLSDTGSLVPQGFEAYCRIFHPWDDGRGRRRSWSDVAHENGRRVHAEMQAHMIDRPVGEPAPPYDGSHYVNKMEWGRFPLPERNALVDILTTVTSANEPCWFCVWEGYGDVDTSGTARRVHLPARNYLLYAGPLDLALARLDDIVSSRSPNIWWPESRSWVVVTEVDYAWTYVGGPRELIESVVGSDRLEALFARLTDQPFSDSDLVNLALDAE